MKELYIDNTNMTTGMRDNDECWIDDRYNDELVTFHKSHIPALIAALSELTGGQTWEEVIKNTLKWLRENKVSKSKIRDGYWFYEGRQLDIGYTDEEIMYKIKQHLPLLPNTVGDGWIKKEPLSEEKLLGYGFEKPHEGKLQLRCNDWCSIVWSPNSIHIRTYGDTIPLPHIEFMHQVNDLYLQLSGQPLPPAPNQNNEG